MRTQRMLRLDSDIREVIVKMSEGNIGGLSVIIKLMEDPMGIIYLGHLDDLGIYGCSIWIGYKNICKEDIEAFKEKLVRDRSDFSSEIEKIRNPVRTIKNSAMKIEIP